MPRFREGVVLRVAQHNATHMHGDRAGDTGMHMRKFDAVCVIFAGLISGLVVEQQVAKQFRHICAGRSFHATNISEGASTFINNNSCAKGMLV